MTKPIKKKEVYLADQVYTVAFPSAKPITYREYVLPEYFYATAYFFDSDGVKVTKANVKDYKAWSVELLIRVKENETLEVITSTIKGARTYKGHVIVSLTSNPVKDLDKTATVKATYYKYVADHRAKLMAFAITSAVQSFVYKKEKDGSNSWPLFSRKDVSEARKRGLLEKATEKGKVSRVRKNTRKEKG